MKVKLTYRTRKRLKTLGMTLGILAAAGLVVWLCWVIWLGRFVVYSRQEVRLDFNWQTPGTPVAAEPPEEKEIRILYDDGSEMVVEKTKELQQLSGCYVTAEMLREDVAEVERVIREQPKGSAVMLELKNGSGNFFYDTAIPGANVSSQVDSEAVGELIAYLAKADYYTIACIPAFRDRAYGLENTPYGLHHSSGRYLWAGDDKCYWLDPTKNATRSYLISIALELRDLGFDEVVFTDFCFPPTEEILFEGDKTAALNDAAKHLVYNLATEEFCVSFVCNEAGFVLPEGRTRLYRSDVDAAMAQSVAAGLDLPSTQINLVFLTEAKDTRFDVFGVLRPLPVGVADLPDATTTPTGTSEPAQTSEPSEPGDPADPNAADDPNTPAQPDTPADPQAPQTPADPPEGDAQPQA